MPTSKYSLGFCSQENETSLKNIPVKGKIPVWLEGSLVRTAPSKFEVGENRYRHWFDGLAMLHKFTFDDGKADYSCKFLESKAYRKAVEKNKIVYGEFGTDPCLDLFQKVFTFFKGPKVTDNGIVNINMYGHEFAATTETIRSVKFNLDNLSTEGMISIGDNDVPGQMTIAHPHYDKDGTLYSYITNFGYHCEYNVFSQEAGSEKRKLIASVPTDKPAYMHSMGMTENYLILTEFPLICTPLHMRFGIKPFIQHFHWKPGRGVRIQLIEKKSGSFKTITSEPYFAFHHVNAFEDGNEVIFDIIGYDDVKVIDQLYLDRLRSEEPTNLLGRLWRFTLDPGSGRLEKKQIADVPIELPRINYGRINALPYNYAFGAGNSVPGNFFDNITKIDVNTGNVSIWNEENCYPGEPVFAEKPGVIEEDDGVLLSIVLDIKSQTSFLLILDARNLQEIARANVPQHIPFGFHGQYIDTFAAAPVYH